jgi:hypothetical protein
MRRLILNLLCALFVLLFLFLIYSYFRSYLPQHVRMELHKGDLLLVCWDGGSAGQGMESYDPGSDKFVGGARFMIYMRKHSESHFWVFSSFKGAVMQGMTVQIITIPLWLPLLLTGLIATLLLLARRRLYNRRKLGHCLQCGYDLRSSKEKCPECGTAIPAIAASPTPA